MASDNHTRSSGSFLERLDPRAKFLCFMLLAVQTFGFTSEASLISVSAVLFVAILLGHIPFSVLLKRLASVSVFVLVIVSVNMVTVSGDVLFEVLAMYATREGMLQGIVLSTRIILIIVGATVFVRTTPVPALIDAIEAALRPFRKRLGAVVQVLTISLTMVPVMIQTARHIKKAQLARGAEPDKNIIRQVQFAFAAALPLFAMALRSSEHLAQAMESRAYNPLAERTAFSRLQMTIRDWYTLALVFTQFLLVPLVITYSS